METMEQAKLRIMAEYQELLQADIDGPAKGSKLLALVAKLEAIPGAKEDSAAQKLAEDMRMMAGFLEAPELITAYQHRIYDTGTGSGHPKNLGRPNWRPTPGMTMAKADNVNE